MKKKKRIKMLILGGSRKKIFELINSNKNESEVRLATKPSKKIFVSLLSNMKIKKIYLTDGIIKTIPPRVLNALKKANIKIIKIKTKRGRKPIYSTKKKNQVIKLLKKGLKAKNICSRLGISIHVVYKLKKNLKQLKIQKKEI
jgi:hypothetical protein